MEVFQANQDRREIRLGYTAMLLKSKRYVPLSEQVLYEKYGKGLNRWAR